MSFDPVCGRHEVFGSLGAIEFSKSLDCFFFIAGISADRSQRVGRKCDVVRHSQTPRDVPDVRVQTAIFMDKQDRRQFPFRISRCHQIAAGFGVALRGRIAKFLTLDSRIGGGNLLSQKKVRLEGFEHGCRCHAAHGILRSAVNKLTAVDATMHVTVKQIQNFLRKIACFHSLHNGHSLSLYANLGRKHTTTHRPLKSGFRFSRNARTPSALSSLLKVRAKRSLSRSRPSRRFMRAADLMASLAIRRAIGLFSAMRDARLRTVERRSAAETTLLTSPISLA